MQLCAIQLRPGTALAPSSTDTRIIPVNTGLAAFRFVAGQGK